MGKYGEADAQFIFKQILEGLAYLHEERVCHRDIKPSNILITEDKKVYIADFNVAKDCKDTKPMDKKLTELESGEDESEVKQKKPGDIMLTTESDFFDEHDDPDSFKMLTKTAGTLAFAAPERIEDNCYYT